VHPVATCVLKENEIKTIDILKLELPPTGRQEIPKDARSWDFFGFPLIYPPKVMQFMGLEPVGMSMRYRARISWIHAGMLWY
jgi:hypothetical protein